MSNDKTTLSIYVDDAFADLVRSHASEADCSISAYIVETLERRIHDEEFERQIQATQAERRIEELIAEARDTIHDATTENAQARREVQRYMIALWELLKENYSDRERQAALETATERLRADTGPCKNAVDAPESTGADPSQAALECEENGSDHTGSLPEEFIELEADEDQADEWYY